TNPYDPFTEYGDWLRFDHHEGFDTAGLLARALSTADALGDPDQELAVEQAIESSLSNPSFVGLYKKVEREVT
ncbi:MAG TPA: hypothetical protein VFT30_08500, partial [Nitrospira sp.]|nr:hypothetical protein [Nitrospira sp.]